MSKQNTASLPGAIILVEYMCFGGTWRERARRFLWIIPVLVLFAAFVLYAMGLFSGAGIGSMLEDVSGLARETELVSRWSYLCTQFNVLVVYIRLLFLPINQNLDYIYPFKTGFFDGLTFLAFTFLAGLAVLAVWKRKSYPVFTVALFWFFITLSVESSIIPIKDALFEHRLYLPMFGFALIVSYLIFHLLSRKRLWAIVISVSIILSLGTATYLRNRVWQDNITLWSDVLSKNPKNVRARNNLGDALARQGRFKEAISHFSEVLRTISENATVHYNMGFALAGQGDLEKAISHYSEALRINPDYAKAHYNLGNVLVEQGGFKEAISHFSEAVRIKPDYVKAHYNLGIILTRQGNFEKAISHYSEAVRLNPDFSAAVYYNMACIYARQNKIEESIDWLKKAIKSGYKNWGLLKTDKDLENIRGSSYYKEIVKAPVK